MYLSKTLKFSCWATGGIVFAGAGAAGTHFCQPTLERKFFPERLQKEQQLRESLELSSMTVDLQNSDIDEFEEQILIKNSTLQEQEKINGTQKKKISSLGEEIKIKDQEFKDKTAEKEQKNLKLETLKSKIHLQKEDILEQDGLDLNLLKIKIKKIEFKDFDGDLAAFESIKEKGKTVIFKVHKENFTNHEEVVNQIKTQGILFGLSDNFQKWNKEIFINTYDAGYEWKTQDPKQQRSYVFNRKESKINMEKFFKSEYLEEAFKVYLVISAMENLPISYDLSGSKNNLFRFYKESKVPESFLKPSTLNLKGFVSQEEIDRIQVWTGRFAEKEDFIKYWIIKTIDFIKSGKLDLSDSLNPILKSKHYQPIKT